jgi:hypothetical protein
MKPTITPVVSYTNVHLHKETILNDNKKKSGIYRWTNTYNGKFYIGSSYNLRTRIQSYFNENVLNRQKKKSIISLALLKYGYHSFDLAILEYCKKEYLITREQYYINIFKPEYNILKDARSRLGVSHTAETKAKIKAGNIGIKKPEHWKAQMSLNSKLAIPVTITDTLLNVTKTWHSIIVAAKESKIAARTINKYKKNKKLYKGRYLIS